MIEARKRTWLMRTLLALVVGSGPAAQAGDRLVARVDEPFAVAGQLYPAGSLSVRPMQAYNPVSQLLEIQVEGQSLGLLVAAKTADRPAERDELTFKRCAAGHLVLVSVAYQGEAAQVFPD